mmetsp:Transcript_36945/g.91574  ORF Transcript_36945/g.91574 Transcript_36945/m.91574 type:complete len:297 (-) Transcript_36945:63-953(-)
MPLAPPLLPPLQVRCAERGKFDEVHNARRDLVERSDDEDVACGHFFSDILLGDHFFHLREWVCDGGLSVVRGRVVVERLGAVVQIEEYLIQLQWLSKLGWHPRQRSSVGAAALVPHDDDELDAKVVEREVYRSSPNITVRHEHTETLVEDYLDWNSRVGTTDHHHLGRPAVDELAPLREGEVRQLVGARPEARVTRLEPVQKVARAAGIDVSLLQRACLLHRGRQTDPPLLHHVRQPPALRDVPPALRDVPPVRVAGVAILLAQDSSPVCIRAGADAARHHRLLVALLVGAGAGHR